MTLDDIRVLQRAVRGRAYAMPDDAAASEGLAIERLDGALTAVLAGQLRPVDEPPPGQPRLGGVIQFFAGTGGEHLTDPRADHDRAFCRKLATVIYAQPAGRTLCGPCCIAAVRYLLLPC